MAVSVFASGTQTAVIGTAHTLANVNAAGTYRLRLDTSAMLAGDVIEIRIRSKVLTGGTLRGEDIQAFFGVQMAEHANKRSDAYETDLSETDGLVFTLTQTFGTGRAFPFVVTKIG